MFRWLLVVALLLPCGSVVAQTHRVLLIHSYHSGMPWTDGQHAGFVEAIKKGGIPADIYVEYLDSLRFRHDKAAGRENLRRTLYSKFKGNPPEVIAVTDNDAMDFALEERPRFAPDAAVVFCGINGLSPDIRTRYKNLTGVAEEASFQETLELMEQWYPGRRLLVLGEESSTFRGNFQSLRAGNERTTAPFPLDVFQDPVLSHIEAKLRAAGPDTLVFILLRPVNDAGETVDSAVAVRAISVASRQPVFSVWDYMFGYGIVGGKLTSGEAHGQAAAAKVLRILRGDAADSVPIDWESPNRYLFDYQQLARFGLQGKELPPGATVINRPVNFYELHRDKVIAVAAVFTFLLLVGARLLVLNRSIKESRNLLDSIVDNIPVTIFLKRASDLSFVMFNRAGEALLGRRRDEMLGRHDYDFFPKEQAESFIGKDREVLKRDDVVDIAEEPIDTARGTRLLHTRKLALRNEKGQPVYLLGVSEDITDRKAAEEALRRHKEELEEVVQRRTAELRLALDAAQGANRAKSAFLATMSHELRTPLNAILGFSNLVSRDRQLPEHLREKVEIVNRSGEHLLALINDVLEIAKIEAGRLQLGVSAFDLRMMVTEEAAMMRLRAQEKGLRLTLELSPDVPRFIKGDEARLRQIVINLLGNAVKFTERGEVTVRVDVRRNAGLHLLLEVKDTGVGISEADLSKLFKPFVQLAEGGEQKGSGLGLTITKEFVQLMGGTISVESVLGTGSTFRVDLPVEVAERAEVVKAGVLPRGEIAGLAPGQPVYRTLIVEDNGDNRRLLEALLNNLGMQVKVAENGEQAVSVFQEWQPALVLMDRRMPVMDGEEATRRIRRLPGGEKVRIVGVSASAFEEERHELLASGMDDFVRKPYRIEEIYDCLAHQLGLRFVEAVPAEEGGPVALTPGMFASVPESVQRALKRAVETLNAEEIGAAIRQVEQHDAALARALFRIAEEFDYQAILDALPATSTTAGV